MCHIGNEPYSLLAEFFDKEIQEAIFQMKPLEAPGPDWFPTQFYQQHWEIIGREVSHFLIDALNQRFSLERINETYITLIPKIKNAQQIGDFIPISLCNVL